jgi:hypothetical protein
MVISRTWLGRVVLGAVCAVAALAATSGTVHAQGGDSGSITGYVFDQAGNPLPGVKVTASSSTQLGGNKVAYSTPEGSFRFNALSPGTFKVKAEAPRLQTVVQDNVKVGITAAADVSLIMEVAQSKVEEVKVISKTPLVNTTKPNVKEVFDVDFVDQMPHDNRDVIFQQVTNYVAGAIKGGRVRGGGGNQTLYLMDGFNMLRQYPTVKASAAYEIQTAAYGADNATAPGGVVNLVTRSGSNKFEFELGATADHSRLAFFQDETDPKASSHFFVLNPTVSGPIIKDKLWYSANVEFLTRKTGRESDPANVQPDVKPEIRHWFKGTVKLAWQVTNRNKLSSVTNFDEFWMFNRMGLGYTEESQARHRSRNYFSGLIWESLLTDNIVFRSQAAISNTERYTFPESCAISPETCQDVGSVKQTFPKTILTGNSDQHERSRTYSFQFINRLELFLNGGALGEHNITLKNAFMTQQDIVRKDMPGDTQLELNDKVPAAFLDFYSNDPRVDGAERRGWFITQYGALRNSLSLSDQWRPTRYLTVTPGVAYTIASANNILGDKILDAAAISPSLSLAWDATHDGRSVLRASFNQYVDVDVSAVANHTLGTQVSKRCPYNLATQAYDLPCVYSGGRSGATVGRPCGPSGIDDQGNNCNTELIIPKTWEYTVGGEREIFEGMSLAIDGIYRRYSNQYEKSETNQIWNYAGNDLLRTGGYRNGQAQTVMDLGTPDGAYRRYLGVTLGATHREGKLKMQGSYTWSRLDGTVLDGNNNAYGDIPPRDRFLDGPLGDDHRHEIKGNLSYRFTPWLSTSMRYSYYSGLPYSRRFRNNATNSFSDYRAQVGTNPGVDVNTPYDDREARLPDSHSLNAQVAFNFQPLIGQNLEAFFDALNVLGLRTTNAVEENDNGLWGTTTGREQPLRLRFGMRYRY